MKKALMALLSLLFLFANVSFSQTDYRGVISGDFRQRFEDYNFQLTQDMQGVRGLGMGRANTAAVNDVSAIFWNPAATTTLRGLQLSIAADMDFGSQEHQQPRFSGITARTEVTPLTDISFAAAVWPLAVGKRHLALGIAYMGFQNMNTHLETIQFYYGGGRILEQEEMNGGAKSFSSSFAFDILPSLSVGASYNTIFNKSDFELKIGSSYADKTIYFRFTDQEEYSGSFLDFGAQWRVASWLSLAAKVTPEWTFSIAEKKEAVYEANLLTGKEWVEETPADSLATFTIKMPMAYRAGIAVKPTQNMTIALDVQAQAWSETNVTTTAVQGLLVPTQLSDVLSWRFGFENVLPAGRWAVPVRLGYFIEPSPYRDRLYRQKYEGNQIENQGWSIGMGVTRSKFTFDFAFERGSQEVGWWMSSTDYYNGRMFRTKDTFNRVHLGLSYRLH